MELIKHLVECFTKYWFLNKCGIIVINQLRTHSMQSKTQHRMLEVDLVHAIEMC